MVDLADRVVDGHWVNLVEQVDTDEKGLVGESKLGQKSWVIQAKLEEECKQSHVYHVTSDSDINIPVLPVAQLVGQDGKHFIVKPFVVSKQLNRKFDLSSVYWSVGM